MVNSLAGLATGIEDNAVTGIRDALGNGYLMCLGRDLGEQAVSSRREPDQVRIVSLGNHEHMNRRLRVDVAKCKRALAFEHSCRRQLAGRDSAE